MLVVTGRLSSRLIIWALEPPQTTRFPRSAHKIMQQNRVLFLITRRTGKEVDHPLRQDFGDSHGGVIARFAGIRLSQTWGKGKGKAAQPFFPCLRRFVNVLQRFFPLEAKVQYCADTSVNNTV